ncbi:UvrD-helicase domain-containing protein [Cryobacterium tagatosivorans]|uniref:DNA 3'-5' helicase n=1 Tax=Cryobacterium tagatosivorans TaxID=1259199 RepID=A0A4R8UBH0_9MICO|nr:UvrD-helicase domain-containing protein [Cryobacterium tagatosivorans]TFB46957.1 DNA helicase UvrD [Cryobacterium tagatosivorans]
MGRNGTSWRPSYWGRRVAKCSDWALRLEGDRLAIDLDSVPFSFDVGDIGEVTVSPGFVWSTVEIPHPERRIRLRGIPNLRARKLAKTVGAAQADLRHRLRVQALHTGFDAATAAVLLWVTSLEEAAATHLRTSGWLTREFAEAWAASKAAIGFDRLLAEPELRARVQAETEAGSPSIRLWGQDLADFISQQNDHHLATELEACRDFFETVEKSPLTPEQARAVVCFDNRMLVVASAGSGKTSTMVAKAGYALHRSLIPADKILMLAFNAAAAKELQTRTRERLTPLGLDADKVVAKTFHAFGLEIIGKATGRKPSLAPWLDGGGDIKQLGRIVDGLRAADPGFRTQWDFFRAVLANDYPDVDADDAWEPSSELRTAQGEVVKSGAERMIADWLYFHSVDYVHEKPYEIDTVDAEHVQYRPDFYYPAIDIYHEHVALDAEGQAPFEGYLESLHWKRDLHQEHGTTLIETTMAELWSGSGLHNLAQELTQRGIRLRPNPDRIIAKQKPIENERLLQTFRSFLTHTKSNQLNDQQLRERLEELAEGEVRFRDAAFLRLFTPIRREWELKLAAEGCIDFEDMLNLSAEHLEAGDWESPYELVMVDEFQDASHARARLARALVAKPGRHLFAVGDDWQSINRFAGADLSVMTGFEELFGPSEVLRLERTFRFPQSLADVSSQFVLQNPSQLVKNVVSSTQEFPPTIGALSVDTDTAVKAAMRHRLRILATHVRSGAIPSAAGRKLSVLVLGRYRHHSDYLPDCRDFADALDVRFSTIHASKGAEADYIVIPGMVSGQWGFPSTIPNDPVLRMAMPAAEGFKRAEERRLFYVALTRARRGVLLVTIKNRESPFLMELIRDHGITLTNAIGEALDSIVCPKCSRGFMVERTSKRGAFLGCRRYPRCKGTLALP